MAIFHQPKTPIIQIICLLPHSMGKGCQQRCDITDRKPALQDSYFHRASKMAAIGA